MRLEINKFSPCLWVMINSISHSLAFTFAPILGTIIRFQFGNPFGFDEKIEIYLSNFSWDAIQSFIMIVVIAVFQFLVIRRKIKPVARWLFIKLFSFSFSFALLNNFYYFISGYGYRFPKLMRWGIFPIFHMPFLIEVFAVNKKGGLITGLCCGLIGGLIFGFLFGGLKNLLLLMWKNRSIPTINPLLFGIIFSISGGINSLLVSFLVMNYAQFDSQYLAFSYTIIPFNAVLGLLTGALYGIGTLKWYKNVGNEKMIGITN